MKRLDKFKPEFVLITFKMGKFFCKGNTSSNPICGVDME